MARSLVMFRHYGVALSVPVVLTVILLTVGRPLSNGHAALLYQPGVVAVAIVAGLLPSMLTALLSALAFHFFFVPAYFSFKLESGEDLLRLAVFIAVAITTSGLAGRARAQAEAERRRAAETACLYELSQLISTQVDLAIILPTIARTTCQLLQSPSCSIWLAGPDGVLREECVVGTAPPGAVAIEAPLCDGAIVLGLMRITPSGAAEGFASSERKLLDTLVAQTSQALGHARLVEQAAHTEAMTRSDQLRAALIASVSHDLRTPLAAIKGAASSLQAEDILLPQATQLSLAHTIEREVDRLDRTVQNLLDMAKLEGGTAELDCTWHSMPEIIGSALQRLELSLRGRAVDVQIVPELPLVWANGVLLEHLLINLLENAVKYTPPGTSISIAVALTERSTPAGLVVSVRDCGSGIAVDEMDHVFTKFYRGAAVRNTVRGSGLGLTICRGIVEAHGGTIQVANHHGGGAVFTLSLPLDPQL